MCSTGIFETLYVPWPVNAIIIDFARIREGVLFESQVLRLLFSVSRILTSFFYLPVYKRSGYSSGKAIVDINHCDAGSAAIEHS